MLVLVARSSKHRGTTSSQRGKGTARYKVDRSRFARRGVLPWVGLLTVLLWEGGMSRR